MQQDTSHIMMNDTNFAWSAAAQDDMGTFETIPSHHSNNMGTTVDHSYQGQSDSFGPVFWAVNAFILTMLLGMCVWCCFFGGKDNLVLWTSRRHESDQQYAQTIRQRREQRMAARRSTPQKRTARLKRSFIRNKVQMVVKDGDIVEPDEAVGRTEKQSSEIKPTETTTANSETESHNPTVLAAINTGTPTDDSEETNREVVSTVPAETDEAAEAMEEGEANDSNSLASNAAGYLVLRPGNARKAPINGRQVPNCCAVCLGAYDPGDKVVWSSNPECQHAFHLECIMDWFLKVQDGGTPCPCCRQEFTDWETDRQERKIKWAAGQTFDIGSISLR